MTNTTTCYKMIHPVERYNIGIRLHYDTVEEAIGETEFRVMRARKRGFNVNAKWLIIKVTTATITDDNGWFVSKTMDSKAIGLYDNGTVTMY